jgi:DNA-binding MarR family transcriptional regulator
MADRGLVAREAGKGRRLALSLTEAGVALFEQALTPTEKASAALLAPFSEAQQKQFIKLLKILSVSLEGKARAPLVMPDFVVDDEIASLRG